MLEVRGLKIWGSGGEFVLGKGTMVGGWGVGNRRLNEKSGPLSQPLFLKEKPHRILTSQRPTAHYQGVRILTGAHSNLNEASLNPYTAGDNPAHLD